MIENAGTKDVWIGTLVVREEQGEVVCSAEAFQGKLPPGFTMKEGVLHVPLAGTDIVLPLTTGSLSLDCPDSEDPALNGPFPVEHIYLSKEEAEANVALLGTNLGEAFSMKTQEAK